jgi:hypothetical protein
VQLELGSALACGNWSKSILLGITRELRNSILFEPLVVAIRLFMFPVLWLKNRARQGDCLLITAVKF